MMKFQANLGSLYYFTDKPAEWTGYEKETYTEVPVDEAKCWRKEANGLITLNLNFVL